MNAVNFSRLVNKPTRETWITKTLIDHAFTNVPSNIVEVPLYAIGDHYPIAITRKCNQRLKSQHHSFILYRAMKKLRQSRLLTRTFNTKLVIAVYS